jgi:putative transposase
MSVLTDLRNRGVRDVFFIVCDGLKGLPDSVNTVFPQAIVQACVIHLIGVTTATLRYASRKYWDQLARDLKQIYTAPTEPAAWAAFEELEEKWGKPYPAIPKLWRAAWLEFTPFLAYGACCEIACCVGPAVLMAGRMGRGQGVPSGPEGPADVVAGGHARLAA